MQGIEVERAVNTMDRCKTCGGDLVSLGNNNFQCLYCENAYRVSETGMEKTYMSDVQKASSGVDVFDINIGGVLEIRWSDGKSLCSGSGFLISEDGWAITNTHVVTLESGESCGKVEVSVNKKTTTATVLRLGDQRHGQGSGVDLALIKLDHVPSGAKALRFADFNKVRNGERVFVIGNSLGYGTCITSGIVSDKRRNVNGKMLLMTDCAVNGGNSGGPMFNENGLIIGAIVSGISGAEGMNFAIPADTILQFINQK